MTQRLTIVAVLVCTLDGGVSAMVDAIDSPDGWNGADCCSEKCRGRPGAMTCW